MIVGTMKGTMEGTMEGTMDEKEGLDEERRTAGSYNRMRFSNSRGSSQSVEEYGRGSCVGESEVLAGAKVGEEIFCWLMVDG
jgi:hypothetical protein